MHVGGLAIYDTSTAPGGKLEFEEAVEHIKLRGRSVPTMNEVLVHTPLNIDHPYWLAEEDFVPEYHIKHFSLPKPGNWEQLCALVAHIHALPLDRSRPLWEMYFIEGLDGLAGYPKGCVGLLSKIHHASIDGAAGAQIGTVIHDLEPEVRTKAKKTAVEIPSGQRESTFRLLMNAQTNALKYPGRVFGAAREALPSLAMVARGVYKGELKRIRSVPRTRFNSNVSADRIFNSVRFSLGDFRAIKDAIGNATINDVALAVSSGALRRYLELKEELPEESLVAAVPVNIRREGAEGAGGNQVANMAVQLCSDIEDPIERLRAISEATRSAKAYTQTLGAGTMNNLVELAPSLLVAPMAKLGGDFKIVERTKPMFNCSITNVPQSKVPLYFSGAKMISNFGVGPVLNGIGLFQIINSYCDEISVSFSCCRKMMPDPDLYAECIEESYDALYKAVIPRSKRRSQ